jgi:hypothetical protein
MHPLDPGDRPTAVRLELPGVAHAAAAAERELRERARVDRDRCCGYFPALAAAPGILTALPACKEFAARLPQISCSETAYGFNFLRLSLVQQSTEATYHLDSDAATAITGDVGALRRKRILRLLLNLSTHADRNLHYLDVDPGTVQLDVRGSYLSAAQPAALRRHARVATVPFRRGDAVHGVAFPSNLVLHSGVDDPLGHFIAAYGIEAGTA